MWTEINTTGVSGSIRGYCIAVLPNGYDVFCFKVMDVAFRNDGWNYNPTSSEINDIQLNEKVKKANTLSKAKQEQ